MGPGPPRTGSPHLGLRGEHAMKAIEEKARHLGLRLLPDCANGQVRYWICRPDPTARGGLRIISRRLKPRQAAAWLEGYEAALKEADNNGNALVGY